MKAAGYGATQFNMACIGLPSMPDAIPPEAAASVAVAARETGIAIVAVSGTYNMIHPDPGGARDRSRAPRGSGGRLCQPRQPAS